MTEGNPRGMVQSRTPWLAVWVLAAACGARDDPAAQEAPRVETGHAVTGSAAAGSATAGSATAGSATGASPGSAATAAAGAGSAAAAVEPPVHRMFIPRISDA